MHNLHQKRFYAVLIDHVGIERRVLRSNYAITTNCTLHLTNVCCTYD